MGWCWGMGIHRLSCSSLWFSVWLNWFGQRRIKDCLNQHIREHPAREAVRIRAAVQHSHGLQVVRIERDFLPECVPRRMMMVRMALEHGRQLPHVRLRRVLREDSRRLRRMVRRPFRGVQQGLRQRLCCCAIFPHELPENAELTSYTRLLFSAEVVRYLVEMIRFTQHPDSRIAVRNRVDLALF